jgi:hypothetical protein
MSDTIYVKNEKVDGIYAIFAVAVAPQSVGEMHLAPHVTVTRDAPSAESKMYFTVIGNKGPEEVKMDIGIHIEKYDDIETLRQHYHTVVDKVIDGYKKARETNVKKP